MAAVKPLRIQRQGSAGAPAPHTQHSTSTHHQTPFQHRSETSVNAKVQATDSPSQQLRRLLEPSIEPHQSLQLLLGEIVVFIQVP